MLSGILYFHNKSGRFGWNAILLAYCAAAAMNMKRQIMGREVVAAVTGGKLDFGPWEQIFYGEFDGRRRKRVLVKIIGE
jgi:thiamine phosphate synthase YjbQ (UPF0047 family)